LRPHKKRSERRGLLAQTLSGDERKMLAIGRALMMQPKILILDEPTLGLAPVILEQLSKALEKVRQSDSITVRLDEPCTTKPAPKHKIFRYLLRGLAIERPNQV
jgi:branched-chain amino acid transport system ATP-binding protein